MTPQAATTSAETYAINETLRRQVVQATQKLRRYRLARDRARMERLHAAPRLASMIAILLDKHD